MMTQRNTSWTSSSEGSNTSGSHSLLMVINVLMVTSQKASSVVCQQYGRCLDHRLRDIKTFSAFSCCCKRTVCLSKITVPVGRAISGNCGRSRELFVRMHALHRAERSPGRLRKRPDSGRYSWSALPFFMPHRPSPAPSTADSQHPRK
jgi:hypothetical protein